LLTLRLFPIFHPYMREITFVKQNADKWKELEKTVSHVSNAPADEIADHYIQVTDDLSYASTFYPQSNTTQYLNSLSTKVHSTIYKNKQERSSRFLTFFTREIPIAVHESRRELRVALIAIIASLSIGLFISRHNQDYVRAQLGDSYVDMTLENIEKGDPMAVYKNMDPGSMFARIAVNNIEVSFMYYTKGVFLSVMAILSLIGEGFRLGAFIGLFIQKGLLKYCLTALFLHGSLEMSAITIASGAGMVIGNSILFPGTYSRAESIRRAGKRSVKIVVGLVPVFLIAAFFEGFVTRYYKDMPFWLSWSAITLSFSFIGFYFVYLPYRLNRKTNYPQTS
jgi:uncharacterized membrane protein SpoIIM required for sporulation